VVRSTVKGNAVFDITLAPDIPSTTYFCLTGQGTITSGGANTTALQIYTGPIRVESDKRGTSYLVYYSVSDAGGSETVRTEVLQ
jgi:hypothetical protein